MTGSEAQKNFAIMMLKLVEPAYGIRRCHPAYSHSAKRGRALRLVGVEDMIEHVPHGRSHAKGAAALDEARLRQQAIGVKLRQMFDEVVNEPVPDEFLDILRKADNKPSGDALSMSDKRKSAARPSTPARDGDLQEANWSR